MENDLPMICPSLRMYENEDLELLKPLPLLAKEILNDNQKKAESIIRKQNISYELNSVPISPYFWDLNLNTCLFDIYREILQMSNVKDFEQHLDKIDISNSTILNDAKNADTKEYKSYKKFRQSYENILLKISEHLQLFDNISDDNEKNNWNDQLLNLQNQKELAMSEWKVRGFKNLIEKELLRINKSSDADLFLAMSQDAKFTFDAAEKTDVINYGSIHDINFIPFDFMENESGWNNLKLNKEELEALYNKAKNSNQNLPTEILSIDYDEKGVAGIELDFSFVHLKRNWFNKNFMLSDYFEWKQAKPISDGQTISDAFKLPAIPKTMMLIKNLKIILDPNIGNSDVNDPNKLIFFGPLVMKQQLFVNQNNNERFLKVVTDKKTLNSDQLTYLAKKTSPPVLKISAINTAKPQIFESTTGTDPVKPQTTTVVMDRMKMGSILSTGPMLSTVNMTNLQPQNPVKPVTTVDPKVSAVLLSDIKLTSAVFIPIKLPPVVTTANVTFRILDKINGQPVYKCGISIIGTNSNNETNRIFNIETDQNGVISQNLPVGNYRISAKIDEYAIMETNINIPDTNPINLEYRLQRQEIKFKSFFLIGMVCEKMPKINSK